MNKSYTQKFIPYYDMAAEANAALRGEVNKEIPGVSENVTETEYNRISVIEILDDTGASILERPRGAYVTIDAKTDLSDETAERNMVESFSKILSELLPPKNDHPILICGIGNPEIGSDALGKKVVTHTIPTRHLFGNEDFGSMAGFSSTALLTPNVLGNTGIEAAELTAAVSDKITPRAVIIVDALATASFRRLGTSLQITDTGLTPGGGVGNSRPAINKDTLGVPVIAVGVPTVIYPQSIVMDAFAKMKEQLFADEKSAALPNWNTAEEVLYENMQEQMQLFAVTPKDIDATVNHLAKIIAGGIQTALHEEVTADNYTAYFPQ